MHKLVVVLHGAAESEWMERRWSEDFVPLAERMPGLRRVLVGRVRGAPAGPAELLLLHEFLLDDLASLEAAMPSAEGQAAGLALMRFAGERAELFFAEHHEMSLDRLPGAAGTAEGAGGPLLPPDQGFPSPLDDRPAGPGSWWRVWRWGRWRRSTSEFAPAPGASCDFGSISRIPPITPPGRSTPAIAAARRRFSSQRTATSASPGVTRSAPANTIRVSTSSALPGSDRRRAWRPTTVT